MHRVETDEYRAALEWNAALFASGAVHPDAVADQTGEAKARFQSGKSLIANDGVGGWHEALRDNLASNPALLAAAVRRRSTPTAARRVLWKGNPANIFSFLKKTDDEAQGRGAARDGERARRAVRHHRVRH